MTQNIEQQLQQQVQQAITDKQPLNIFAGKSKHFYGRPVHAQDYSIAKHQGITNYKASELVITARAGTSLNEIENTLAEHNQTLAFEAPAFTPSSTLGGCVAAGLSGPARPSNGAARDFMLGCRMINGKGEIVQFGGQVIKNVAGYDVSRLITGSLGTLGLILEISLKVLPRPAHTISLIFEMDEASALKKINQLLNKPHPITASYIREQTLCIRLSGTETSLTAAQKKLGGERCENNIWLELQNQHNSFFTQKNNLWRISLPPATAPLSLAGSQLIEWHGAQRWLYSDEDISVQKKIKQAMDPHGIFNPGRMYQEV